MVLKATARRVEEGQVKLNGNEEDKRSIEGAKSKGVSYKGSVTQYNCAGRVGIEDTMRKLLDGFRA